ncbi:TetR/AcrR family transcriptional regulator [Streptomyces cupreus]|uniref:TetR/AcrR family transcriptional regulator n=1 Tax=Streptomyces cupreus TaxID=2759956 RepID=A0A7X1M9W5_9ACTN|nr:TetR/AcrR family transcriptional regulator [Streptomyces cupreus]MBC2903684.1 TetR/AcrR family transcriptional regulator [Streptomyces cupreus]
MSPRARNPTLRAKLVEAAAHLLAEEGPAALSARRLTAEVGASTMAVYTYFGSMEDVIRGVVREGFARLAERLAEVADHDDPVTHLAELGRAYRRNALAHPHMYAVMLGGSALGGFRLSEDDRARGAMLLDVAMATVERCTAAGRFRAGDAWMVTRQYWCCIHGHVQLDLGGYFLEPDAADTCFEELLRDFAVGSGDQLDAATRSVRARTAEDAPAP